MSEANRARKMNITGFLRKTKKTNPQKVKRRKFSFAVTMGEAALYHKIKRQVQFRRRNRNEKRRFPAFYAKPKNKSPIFYFHQIFRHYSTRAAEAPSKTFGSGICFAFFAPSSVNRSQWRITLSRPVSFVIARERFV